MIHRRKRRPLAARGDIGGTEIVRHRYSGPQGEFGGIADLPGPSPVGLVQNGMAVETYEVRLLPQRGHRAHVIFGQPRRGAFEPPVVRVQARCAVQDAPQIRPQAAIVGHRQGRTERSDPLAVGLQPGGIDAIQRGSAHQSDGAQHFSPIFPWAASVLAHAPF